MRLEVLKPQVDDSGYGLVLEANHVVRHIQGFCDGGAGLSPASRMARNTASPLAGGAHASRV